MYVVIMHSWEFKKHVDSISKILSLVSAQSVPTLTSKSSVSVLFMSKLSFLLNFL